MDTLMERVRLANFADLEARRRSGLLRGLMFLHMKAGLNANVIRLQDTTESYDVEVTLLSQLGVRRDFQQAIAELRTDLNAFLPVESLALMACGYQMAGKALEEVRKENRAVHGLVEHTSPIFNPTRVAGRACG